MLFDTSNARRRRRLPVRIVLVVMFGVVVFSLTHGIEQHGIAQSTTTTIGPARNARRANQALLDSYRRSRRYDRSCWLIRSRSVLCAVWVVSKT